MSENEEYTIELQINFKELTSQLLSASALQMF